MSKAVINADEVDELTIVFEGVPVTLSPWEWWDIHSRKGKGAAAMTPAQVYELRERFHLDGASSAELAKEFGISQRSVFRIARCHTHTAVPMPKERRPYSAKYYDPASS